VLKNTVLDGAVDRFSKPSKYWTRESSTRSISNFNKRLRARRKL